jgi:peptidyl-prolyl cis-trans isomerase SurA
VIKRISFAIFIFFLMTPLPSLAKVFDRVVGVVDGEVITLADLDEAMPQYGLANILNAGNPLDKEMRLKQAREAVLQSIIEDKLLHKATNRLGIKVGTEDADDAFAKMKEDGKIDDAQAEKELIEQGFSAEGYQHFLTVQIRRARIIDSLIKPNISMAEEKLREYYQANMNKYQSPELRVSQIVIQVPPEPQAKDWETAKKKMDMVLENLKKGATFEEMARQYSDDSASASSGGDLGFFAKGEIMPLLEAVVFNMNVGEISETLQSAQALHIFKVTDKKEGTLYPFDEIKERIMADYYREEVSKRYIKWLDDLKARSNVEVKL